MGGTCTCYLPRVSRDTDGEIHQDIAILPLLPESESEEDDSEYEEETSEESSDFEEETEESSEEEQAQESPYDKEMFAEIQSEYGLKMTEEDYQYDSDEYDENDLSACYYCQRGYICEAIEGQGVGDVFWTDDWICRRCVRFLERAGLPHTYTRDEEEEQGENMQWLKHSGIPEMKAGE